MSNGVRDGLKKVKRKRRRRGKKNYRNKITEVIGWRIKKDAEKMYVRLVVFFFFTSGIKKDVHHAVIFKRSTDMRTYARAREESREGKNSTCESIRSTENEYNVCNPCSISYRFRF